MTDECDFVGDGQCDGDNNNAPCNYDGGDCCLEPSDCSFCSGEKCVCHETGVKHCGQQ